MSFEFLDLSIFDRKHLLNITITSIIAKGKLKLVNGVLKVCNSFFFALELTFFMFQCLNLIIFSFDFVFKICDFIILFVSNRLNHFFFHLLNVFIELSEVCLNNFSHSREILK